MSRTARRCTRVNFSAPEPSGDVAVSRWIAGSSRTTWWSFESTGLAFCAIGLSANRPAGMNGWPLSEIAPRWPAFAVADTADQRDAPPLATGMAGHHARLFG